jgi:hypothetical protein
MSQERKQQHLDRIRAYVDEELAWGRENLEGEEWENFRRHTVDYYLRELEKLLGKP